MWQGWAIGDFDVSQDGSYLLHCINTKVFYIDSPMSEFPADWYTLPEQC